MPVLGDVKVLPEHLLESARRLRARLTDSGQAASSQQAPGHGDMDAQAVKIPGLEYVVEKLADCPDLLARVEAEPETPSASGCAPS